MMKTVVIAIGGNSLIKDAQHMSVPDQYAAVVETARHITDLLEHRYGIVITHGNGPQAGALLIQQEESEAMVPGQSLAACGAMTQGHIGWMIQNRLSHYLRAVGMNAGACSLITQVLVSVDDPDFEDPSKPVGPFYSEKDAETLQRVKHYCMKLVKPSWNHRRRV